MPNQPATPARTFRLSDDSIANLDETAKAINATSRSEALRHAIDQTAAAVRLFVSYSPSAVLGTVADALRECYPDPDGSANDRYRMAQVAIDTLTPIVRERARRDTLRDVVTRLEGFGVAPDVIAHFSGLADAPN